jgi:hypothetical protein
MHHRCCRRERPVTSLRLSRKAIPLIIRRGYERPKQRGDRRNRPSRRVLGASLFVGNCVIQSTPPERLDVWATSGLIPTIRTAPFPTAIRRSRHRKTGDDTSGARLTRRLERICEAWNDFQSSRARDAVYGYLAHVLAIVEHYKVRRKTSKLLRQAFEFANLRFNKNGDPFTAIIRCTSDDSVDSKTISKWARALRYVARCKKPTTPLKRFVKRNGGINACANLYARYFGPGRQGYVR